MNVRLAIVTGFGIGRVPLAPGTAASAATVAVALLLASSLGPGDALTLRSFLFNGALVLLGLAFAIACVRFGAEAEQFFARKDPKPVVADEVAGQAIALLVLPWREFSDAAGLKWNLSMAVAAFILFRAFDIIKPPPIRGTQRLRGGWGILIDDLLAGAAAMIVLQIIVRMGWLEMLTISL